MPLFFAQLVSWIYDRLVSRAKTFLIVSMIFGVLFSALGSLLTYLSINVSAPSGITYFFNVIMPPDTYLQLVSVVAIKTTVWISYLTRYAIERFA